MLNSQKRHIALAALIGYSKLICCLGLKFFNVNGVSLHFISICDKCTILIFF